MENIDSIEEIMSIVTDFIKCSDDDKKILCENDKGYYGINVLNFPYKIKGEEE